MGWFTREEKMNMETGKFETVKKGLFHRESKTPISDKLLAQAKQQKYDSKLERKKKLREAFEEAKYNAKLARMKREGHRVGSMSMRDRFNNLASGFNMNYSVGNNYNPFGNLFDTGLGKPTRTKHKTSSGKQKYVVVGGKAYPVVGGKGKKKSKKKSSSSGGFGGFDMMDNWGVMK